MPDPGARPGTSRMVEAAGLICALTACFATAGLGWLATVPNLVPWYASLSKPSWNPPNWLFGPVWTLLYTLMAVAAWLIWRQRGRPDVAVAVPLCLFGIQLLLNALWSWLFFGWHQTTFALAEIILLWLAILATMISFRRVSPAGSILMLPYLLWVGFAIGLNAAIVRLN